MRRFAAFTLFFAAPAAAAQLLFAGGQWVALERSGTCEAASRSLRIAQKGKVQARAGFAFDANGVRRGQLFAELSRVPRAGSTVILTVGTQPFMLETKGRWAWSRDPPQEAAIIAAVRAATGMRLDSRDFLFQRLDPLFQLVDRQRVEVLLLELGDRIAGLVREEFVEVHRPNR
jgi:hypothetical protein